MSDTTNFSIRFPSHFRDPEVPSITDDRILHREDLAERVRAIQPAVRFTNDVGNGLLDIYVSQYDRLLGEIAENYDQRLVETASGQHLERLGAKYDIERKTNELDAKLRKRIEAARLVGQSRGTYRDIAELVVVLFEVDTANTNLLRPPESNEDGTAIVRVPQSNIDNSPFTKAELTDLLGDAIFGGHRIVIEPSSAFRFGDPDNGFGSRWGKSLE